MLRKPISLGKLLVDNNVITQAQLDDAIDHQKKTGERLGKVLINLKMIDEEHCLKFLAEQFNVPYIDLKKIRVNPEIASQLPESTCIRFKIILLEEKSDYFLVGMVDPQDIFAYDELSRTLRSPIKIALVQEDSLFRALDEVFRKKEEMSSYVEQLSSELKDREFEIHDIPLNSRESDAPVVKLLQSLFEDAITMRASDIHIEPDESVLRIRLRIDGVLQERVIDDVRISSPLTVRLKLMANLNISESRMPQDGRFTLKVRTKIIDVRLSSLPTQYGESIVMRLLDHTKMLTSISDLHLPKWQYDLLNQLIHLPNGMILVTGPTGSGKTSTLYAILNELNVSGSKIITVEDPVEYRLPRINQVQVNHKINLDFARVLRASLRQDPDIIMVGEIRDSETSQIALRAATTGHFVLATLHTNDIKSSIVRLLDMGNLSYLIASSVKAIISQRLVRKICVNCITDYEPNKDELALFQSMTHNHLDDAKFKNGAGCRTCLNTGYLGRLGVYELLSVNKDIEMAITNNDSKAFDAFLSSEKHVTILAYAGSLAKQGLTTMQEVMRLSAEISESSQHIDRLKS